MSQEYILSLVLVLGGVLKLLGVEIDNSALEGLVGGVIALWIAIRRFSKGDINVIGAKRV
jgi:hypothetical protein